MVKEELEDENGYRVDYECENCGGSGITLYLTGTEGNSYIVNLSTPTEDLYCPFCGKKGGLEIAELKRYT